MYTLFLNRHFEIQIHKTPLYGCVLERFVYNSLWTCNFFQFNLFSLREFLQEQTYIYVYWMGYQLIEVFISRWRESSGQPPVYQTPPSLSLHTASRLVNNKPSYTSHLYIYTSNIYILYLSGNISFKRKL